jgi:Holliday junction DNA helicase RuvB
MLTGLAFQHMGLAVPQGFVGMQANLFDTSEDDV